MDITLMNVDNLKMRLICWSERENLYNGLWGRSKSIGKMPPEIGNESKFDKKKDENDANKERTSKEWSLHDIFRTIHAREEGRNDIERYTRETKFPYLNNVNHP